MSDGSFRHTATQCPDCGKVLDAAKSADGDRAPKPDDLSVCLYCGSILQFDAGMSLVALTPTELRRLDPEDRAKAKYFQAEIRERNARG